MVVKLFLSSFVVLLCREALGCWNIPWQDERAKGPWRPESLYAEHW